MTKGQGRIREIIGAWIFIEEMPKPSLIHHGGGSSARGKKPSMDVKTATSGDNGAAGSPHPGAAPSSSSSSSSSLGITVAMKDKLKVEAALNDQVTLVWVVMAVISIVGLVILLGPSVVHHVNSTRPEPLNPRVGSSSFRNAHVAREVAPQIFEYTVENTVIYPQDQPKFDRLRRWVKENGGKIDGTEIRSWPGTYERGIFALKEFVPGDHISIPKKISLSTLHAMDTPVIGQYVRALKDVLGFDVVMNDRLALALYITYEKLVMREKSFWFPYLDTLAPSSTNFTHFLFATEEQFSRFQVDEQVTRSFAHHREGLAELFKGAKIISHIFTQDDDTLLRELRWAYYMILSRAWSRSKDGVEYLEMTPYGDIINHRIHGDLVTASSDTENIFLVTPGRKARPGVELFDSYHHHPTVVMYAQLWGFVPDAPDIFMIYDRVLDVSLTVDHRRLLSFFGCLRGPSVFGTEFSCGEQDFFADRAALTCWRLYRLSPTKVAPSLAYYLEQRLLHRGLVELPSDDTEDLTALGDLMQAMIEGVSRIPKNPNDVVLQNDPSLTPVERLMVRMRYMTLLCHHNVLDNVQASMVRFLS